MGPGCESSLSGLQPHRGHQHRSNPILCNVRTGSYTWNRIFPVPKADWEMGLSDWIEVVRVRFQRDTTSHSTPEFSIQQTDHVKVGSWRVGLDFWTEDYTWKLCQVKIILGWTVQDCREIFPALAEVMEVYERGKPRTVCKLSITITSMTTLLKV